MKIVLFGLLCTSLSYASGSNILVAMPLPTYSHTIVFMPIIKELAKRGHNVTMVSPFPQKTPVPNLKDVVMRNTLEDIMSKFNGNHDVRQFQFIISILGLWPMCNKFLDPVFEMKEFQEFLNDRNSQFDLIIIEAFFCQQPLLALGHKYKAPVVTLVAPSLSPSPSEISGNSNPFAYVPHFALKLSDHMTFLERMKNTLVSLIDIIVSELYGTRLMDKYIKENLAKYPGFEDLPTVSEMQRNISLFMVDSHFSLNYPRPYLPNVIEFGGLSAKSGEKLPEDLEKFISESKNGVIFFTWGSHYPMTNMRPELLKAFMSVFGGLKQRVLMKWENDTLPGKPDNVKIDRWFPQASILAHPNTRLFISHGGIHGVTESIYHAVPLLGTALFGDQAFNLHMAEQAGMALNVDIDTVTEEELRVTINKLLNDPKFKENAKKKSRIMRDRPISALDNAVYWIEYVLRHDGARHLRPGSLDLTWYQNMLLDVVTALLAGLIALLMFLSFIIKLLFKLFKRKNKANNKATKEEKNKKDKKKVKKTKKE